MFLMRRPDNRNNAISTLMEDLEKSFFGEDAFFNSLSLTGSKAFVPALDIAESDKDIKVKIELPGLAKKDIKVSVTDNILTVTGEKKAETENKEKGYYHIERTYGSFQRAVRLPDTAQGEKAKSVYKDGVLEISVPKDEKALPKTKHLEIE